MDAVVDAIFDYPGQVSAAMKGLEVSNFIMGGEFDGYPEVGSFYAIGPNGLREVADSTPPEDMRIEADAVMLPYAPGEAILYSI